MGNGTSSDHLAKLLRVFLKMRRKREELSKAFNDEDAKIKEAQEAGDDESDTEDAGGDD